MSPLFMDTGYEPNSPGSLSAEESNSNTAGSEREGEGQQVGNTGRKRRERNRDAARKTRRKQTERADELHEELQRLERSNSALHKEIAALKKDLHHYTTALAHHEPYCCFRASGSGSATDPSAKRQTSSSPPRVAPQVSSATLAAAPSVSTSLASSLVLQTLDCVENTHHSSSASAPTTLASGTSTELVMAASSSSSSPVTLPYSASFSTLPAPHSLFSEEPIFTSRTTNVTPVCTSLVSSPVPSSAHTTAAQPQSGHSTIPQTPAVPANACFSTLNPGTMDEFLMKQTSFLPASSNVVPPYSHLGGENESLVAHGCSMNAPQLHPGQYSGNPNTSSPLAVILPSHHQGLEPPPAPAFALKPSYRQQMAANPAPLLSLLTVPSPLNMSQTTSNSSDGLTCQPAPSLPLMGDPSSDLSLSELLEGNDWILGGSSNQ